jgi:colanic acid/amylovoran biosynthesis protein
MMGTLEADLGLANEMINITLVNAHWNNRGDEAALRALLEGLKQVYKPCRIIIIFKDGKPIAWFPKMEGVSYFPAKFFAKQWDIWLSVIAGGYIGKNDLLKKTIKTLKKSDLIIYSPGGSVINDRFFWSKQMEYLVPFICARLYRIPLFVAAPSIGPFDTESPNRLRKWLLETPKITCVREAISQRYLNEIGIRKNVHVTMDLAFVNDIDKVANEKRLKDYGELRQFLDSHEKVVGITITDFRWHIKLRKDQELLVRIEEAFHKFINRLESKGYGVLLIPQLFGNENDHDYLKGYCDGSAFLMDDNMDTYFQQHVISKLYAVIGLRYHSNIFAAKTGTPFVAVVYEEKMQGFLELASLEDYSLKLAEISCDNLEGRFSKLEQDHEAIGQSLRKNISDWRKRALRTMELLKSIEIQ